MKLKLTERISIKKEEPKVYEAMFFAEKQIAGFGLDKKLVELVKIRASQLNGCGYCLDKHCRDARESGETEQRLHTLAAWRETPFFTEQEQAALQLTEEVTYISKEGVKAETYHSVVALFGEQGFAQLLFLILTINNWNRIAIATHMMPEVTVSQE